MRKDDSVRCVHCGREFSVRLLELVRWGGPLWCKVCVAYADHELEEASERVRIAQEGLVGDGWGVGMASSARSHLDAD